MYIVNPIHIILKQVVFIYNGCSMLMDRKAHNKFDNGENILQIVYTKWEIIQVMQHRWSI